MRICGRIGLIVVLAMTGASCGYALAGRGTFLPASIRIIGIPEFVNNTPYFGMERPFTDRVRSEFIGRGKWEVRPVDTEVDAVLRVTISSASLAPANFNDQQQATRYTIVITTAIQFVEVRTNKTLWENPSMAFREQYDLPADTAAADPTAFFGQASNAVGRVANDFARTIVSTILEAF